MSQPVPPPSRPQQPEDGRPVEGNPYAAEAPGAQAPAAPPVAPPAGAPVAPPVGAPVAQAGPPVGPPVAPAPGAPTGNPFAGAQPGQPGPPPGTPWPAQPGQPGQYPGVPFAPVAGPVRNNLALGLLASLGSAAVIGAVYGAIIGATEREFGYAAVVLGLVTGWAAGKAGGRNPALPFAAALFSLASVYFGQLLGEAIIASKHLPVSVSEMFFEHFGVLQEAWKADADFFNVVFFALAAFASFSTAKKLSD
ncbi:hypothetical protein OG599_21100 [Streptomyces sp. NBC_01335]|uniref:hypothetical protein n=1 Tax=Streptomyces sp. NBC_01335 TaxID=2903828 RepID=UPI002E15BD43|nr:hypothetical protein OG599_21100 [Streptomyces sp. NBC_01335]